MAYRAGGTSIYGTAAVELAADTYMHSGRKKASGRRADFFAGTCCAPTPTEPKDGDENDKGIVAWDPE